MKAHKITKCINYGKKPIKVISRDPFVVGTSNNLHYSKIQSDMAVFEAEISCLCSSINAGKLIGLKDGSVTWLGEKREIKPIYKHESGVTCISRQENIVVSVSWDKKCIIYNLATKNVLDIYEHPVNIWGVKILSDNRIVTSSADGCIRIFNSSKTPVAEFKVFNLPIRGLLVDKTETFIYACDNEGKMVKIFFDGRIKRSRDLDNLIYNIVWHNDLIVAVGEGGFVFILNTQLEIQEKLQMSDCSELWCAQSVGEKIYLGGSSGNLYEIEPSEYLPERLTNRVNDSKINSKDSLGEVSEGDTFIQHPNGEIERVKKNETSAYKTFKVELGGKYYDLRFKKDENTHEITNRFIQENNIPDFFFQQIYDYIITNFKQEDVFLLYKKLNVEGIKKVIGEHKILELVFEPNISIEQIKRKPIDVSIYDIENILMTDTEIPDFIKLDIYKYLAYKKLPMNWGHLYHFSLTNRKTALSMCILLANLIPLQPFNLESLDAKIMTALDRGLLNREDTNYYFNNQTCLKNKK